MQFIHLLKLTAALVQVCIKKLAILDEYLIHHCWMLTPDHHLDDRLSLSHVSRRRRRRRRGPRVCAINDVHSWMTGPRISGQLYMTQVTEATSRINCSKNILAPLLGDPWKHCHQSGEIHVRTELYHHANFHADRRQLSVPGLKIHIFLIEDSPGVIAPCYTFLESSIRSDFML